MFVVMYHQNEFQYILYRYLMCKDITDFIIVRFWRIIFCPCGDPVQLV